MRITLVQMSNSGSIELNLKKAIKKTSDHSADLALSPEVQLTEFSPQYPHQDAKKYQTSLNSPVVGAFRDVCKENHIMGM